MYSGSEDGTVKIWDMRAPGFQREYASRGAVNSVVLHPNQGELISGNVLSDPVLKARECTCALGHSVGDMPAHKTARAAQELLAVALGCPL